MILKLNTTLISRLNINLNQWIFISIVLNDNQNNINQSAKLVNMVNDADIQDLINRKLISKQIENNNIKYIETKYLKEILNIKKNYFDEFNILFPEFVIRPDGINSFLKTNIKKCKTIYNKIVDNDDNTHNMIMNSLNEELKQRTINGNMSYIKTMWNWLTSESWLAYKDKNNLINENKYGTELL